MTKETKKIQKGGVLLEAMAVLGLLTVASPVVYKKAIEKTKEIEDVTVASQMRTIRDAAATYIEKNYETVEDGSIIRLGELKQYLPPNFMGNMSRNLVDYNSAMSPEEAANNAVKIVVRKNVETTEKNALPVKRASAYVITNKVVGSGSVDEKRGNHIASLIGAEGGYVTDSKIMGSNNSWMQNLDTLNAGLDPDHPVVSGDDLAEGHIVAGTTFTKDPLSGDFLYRNSVEGFPQFNMMMTNLDINGNSIKRVRNLGFKYNKDDTARNSIKFDGETGAITGTNAAGSTGVKTLEIKANNSGAFKVMSGNEKGCSSAEADYNGTGAGGLSGCNRAGKQTVEMTAANDGGQHGMLSVSNSSSDSEALSYATEANGGVFDLSGSNGNQRAMMVGKNKEDFGEFSSEASQFTLHSSDGATMAYAGATATGGRILLGEGDLSSADNQTILADAESAMVASKKTSAGYAAMAGRYKSNPGYMGSTEETAAALLVSDNNTGNFALDKGAVAAVLSTHNNSGYMRLNSAASEKVKISAVHFNEAVSGGALYLKGKSDNNAVKMESNDGGNGYAEFSTANGKSVLSTKDGAVFSAYQNDDATAVLSAANSLGDGGVLTLKSGTTEYAVAAAKQNDANSGSALSLKSDNNASVTIGARTSNDNPQLLMKNGDNDRVNIYAAGGEDSNSSAMKLSNSSNVETVKVYAYKTADEEYGTTGTINISDGGKQGVDIHGKLKTKENVFGKSTEDGGVIVTKKADGTATGWLAGNGNASGGMASLSTTKDGFANRVDLYAKGGEGGDMGGTGHVIGAGDREGSSMYAKFDGKYEPMKVETIITNRGEYVGYAVSETDNVKAVAVNSTDVYTKGGIDVNGNLYTNVLCINLPNDEKKNGSIIDSFGKSSVADSVNEQIDATGDKKCVALSPDAKWKDIIYEVVASYTSSAYGDSNPLYGDQKPKIATHAYAGTERSLRGHEHVGFAKYGHKHESYLSLETEKEHHADAEGKAKWNRVSNVVGEYCTRQAKIYSKSDSVYGSYNDYCCSEPDTECDTYNPDSTCKSGHYKCSNKGSKSGNDVENCCNTQSVSDERKSYWESMGKK